MPRNPSEIARLEEERALLRMQLAGALYRDKQTKTKILRELREVEEALGISQTAYNSSDF